MNHHQQTEQTRKIAQQYRHYWDTADVDGIFSILSMDAEYISFSGNNQTKPEDLISYVKMALPSPQANYIYHDELRVDREIAISTYSFIYRSSITGKENTYRGCDVMTILEGKIIRVHEYSSIIEIDSKDINRVKIALDDYRINTLSDDINHYFNQHQPYLNPNLKLDDIVKATGYTRNQISYVLNHVFGTSFYDFINQARIEYLLKQLNHDNKQHINDIAAESGFNSSTTFYKFFKQKTGLTPKAYVSRHVG